METFSPPGSSKKKNIGKLIVTQNDDKWIIVPRGNDAYVVDKTGTQKERLIITSYFNNGVDEIFNRMNDVYSIAEDNEGAIWIGTSKGIAVYSLSLIHISEPTRLRRISYAVFCLK